MSQNITHQDQVCREPMQEKTSMQNQNNSVASSGVFLGVFLISMSTLIYEILLTRIFSVTTIYHFAFMAVSIAMFGMALGARLIYSYPKFFTIEKNNFNLSLSSLLFAISVPISILIQLNIPFASDQGSVLAGLFMILCLSTLIPFTLSGISICLALTKFPKQVNKLYAADLIGAAIGCLALIFAFQLADLIGAIFLCSFLALSSAYAFIGRKLINSKSLFFSFLSISIILISLFLSTTIFKNPIFKLKWSKGIIEQKSLYEKWNSFSRVKVTGNPNLSFNPLEFSVSKNLPQNIKVKQLSLAIDSNASTNLTQFNGDLKELDFLKYDITNLAHQLRNNADVLVIGVGGGRDILSALAFNQKSVKGIEINNNIIRATNQAFGDFTGHLDEHPKVKIINDEARSYIARSKDKVDIIQVALIDTWAATSSGAFALTENSLYTVEAWKLFFSRLNSGGILTFTRWYSKTHPTEIYRLTSLAATSLLESGIDNPRKNIVIIKKMLNTKIGVSTMIISQKAFSQSDLVKVKDFIEKMDFEIVLSPSFAENQNFEKMTESKQSLNDFIQDYSANIIAPRDNSPFFFQTLKVMNVFKKPFWSIPSNQYSGLTNEPNTSAVEIVVFLFFIVLTLTLVFLVGPLWKSIADAKSTLTIPFSIYFLAIGFGFMLIEISQMQRLTIFLGHPTYSLSVVLFTLLLSTGVGSYLVYKFKILEKVPFIFILSSLLLMGFVTPILAEHFQAGSNFVRISLSVFCLFPIGLFLGIAFPLGINAIPENLKHLSSWLWGLNGAASVCGSVLAVIVALTFDIQFTYWVGFLFYLMAFLSYKVISRK